MTGRVFIDVAKIFITSGAGGNGCVAFRREKFVPKGGPSGGDGGNGGSVHIEATTNHNTLFHFKKYPHHRAKRGQHGMGSKCKGKKGEDIVLFVPVGTVIHDDETGDILDDLTEDGQRIKIARGGKGGRGNAQFATSTNQAPMYAEDGKPGEEVTLRLELKLMASVGLVGLPNAGKSTLLSAISSAKPKVGDYPFTTLDPQLGVVAYPDLHTITVAEIPGIIEGAHEGKGLGLKFLRHAERVLLICHLVDISDMGNPEHDLKILEEELASYGILSETKRVLVGTKIDAATTTEQREIVSLFAKENGYSFFAVSAVSGEGIKPFLTAMRETVSVS